MKKNKIWKRAGAVILSTALLFGTLPTGVMAEETVGHDTNEEELLSEEVVSEDEPAEEILPEEVSSEEVFSGGSILRGKYPQREVSS